jgi:hypothetical protein
MESRRRSPARSRSRGPTYLSAAILPRVLKPLREAAPGIRVRILASSESMENLTQRDADIAIRHVRPDQPDLIARHLGDFRANLYAASDYLDRAGRPRTPRDIADHDFVGNADPERLMAPLHNMGVPVRPESFVMSSANGIVAWEVGEGGLRHLHAARIRWLRPSRASRRCCPAFRRWSSRSGLSRTGSCRPAAASGSSSICWRVALSSAVGRRRRTA